MKFLSLFALLLLDSLSKVGALLWVAPLRFESYPYGGIPLFSDFLGVSFSLNTVFNTGAAWGLFSGYPSVLFALRVVVIGALVFSLCAKKGKGGSFSLWLIATGALGNAFDYLFYGHVVDFFHFVFWGYSFPIFNCADAYISLGAAWLILAGSSSRKKVLSA